MIQKKDTNRDFKKAKSMCSVLLVLCFVFVTLCAPLTAFAEEANVTNLSIKIGDVTYDNISTGSTINVDTNLKDLTFWVTSVNGNALVNVGNNSGVKDSQGRNPLEINFMNETDKAIRMVLKYHAEDDTVEANRSHPFEITDFTITTSADFEFDDKPPVSKVKNFTATALKAALKVNWKKSSVDGYQIQYSTSKKFDKSLKKLSIAKSKTSTTIKKLKGSKTYYVRIRGYKYYDDKFGKRRISYGKWVTVSKKTKSA